MDSQLSRSGASAALKWWLLALWGGLVAFGAGLVLFILGLNSTTDAVFGSTFAPGCLLLVLGLSGLYYAINVDKPKH